MLNKKDLEMIGEIVVASEKRLENRLSAHIDEVEINLRDEMYCMEERMKKYVHEHVEVKLDSFRLEVAEFIDDRLATA